MIAQTGLLLSPTGADGKGKWGFLKLSNSIVTLKTAYHRSFDGSHKREKQGKVYDK